MSGGGELRGGGSSDCHGEAAGYEATQPGMVLLKGGAEMHFTYKLIFLVAHSK